MSISLRAAARTFGPAAVVVAVQQVAFPSVGPDGGYQWGLVLRGVTLGLLGALVALGMALTYRAHRVVNFAQGALGLVPVTLATYLILLSGLAYLAGLAAGLVAAVALGAVVELAVIRRFFRSPRLALTVATIGLAQLLAFLALVLPDLWDRAPDEVRITVPWHWSAWVAPFRLDGDDLLALVVAPLAIVALAAFLHRTDVGIAARAAADRADRAASLGIPVGRIHTCVWVVATVLSFLALFLQAGVVGLPLGVGRQPHRAARRAGRARPRADDRPGRRRRVGGGAGPAAGPRGLERRAGGRPPPPRPGQRLRGRAGAGGRDPGGPGVPAAGHDAGRGRRHLVVAGRRRGASPRPGAAPGCPRCGPPGPWPPRWSAALVVALPYLPVVGDPGNTLKAAAVLVFVVVGLSIMVLTGWAGQVSLGQMGVVAIGAALGAKAVTDWGLDLALALPLAGLVGALVAVLVGLPALRLRGIHLAVSTLAFALATVQYLLNPQFFGWVPTDVFEPPPAAGPVGLRGDHRGDLPAVPGRGRRLPGGRWRASGRAARAGRCTRCGRTSGWRRPTASPPPGPSSPPSPSPGSWPGWRARCWRCRTGSSPSPCSRPTRTSRRSAPPWSGAWGR